MEKLCEKEIESEGKREERVKERERAKTKCFEENWLYRSQKVTRTSFLVDVVVVVCVEQRQQR